MTIQTEVSDPPSSHLDEEVRHSPPESRVHSFIVKVWLEEVATRNKGGSWRGRIVHVPGGERRYLKDLKDVARFISPYLKSMGIRPGILERIKRWFST